MPIKFVEQIMTRSKKTIQLAAHLLAATVLLNSAAAAANDESISFRLSVGNSWQARNDVQIPNSELGSRFSLEEAVGEGPITAARLDVSWMMNEKHGLRVLLAPLSYTESVTFDEPVLFAGGTFNADQQTDASYKFNSWRLGYFYSLLNSEAASFRIGATLKVRDAEIRLAQGDTVSFDDDLGLVPLLYLAGTYQLSDRWTLGADFDGLAGGPGRAIDLGVGIDYSITGNWKLGAELRVLDGGADVDAVYNFARFNSAALVISGGF
jgi:hypothetical protein